MLGETGKVVYFNEAATSWPKAPGVAEAIAAALAHPAACPGRTAGMGMDVLEDCRGRLAELLDVPMPSRIVLTMNATHALNLAIMGFPFPEGAHVITTCVEHNSVLRPLHHLRQEGRIRLTIIGLDGEGELDREAYLAALAEGASLVAISHASNVTGGAVEVAPLFARARSAGARTLLDASQSIGHVPVRPSELHADMVAFPGHKALRGPSGTGGLYVAPEVELSPVLMGGTGTLSEQLTHPPEMPHRLEAGTPNVLSFAGLNAALDWWSEQGDECVREGHRLGEQLRRGLAEMRGVRVFGVNGHRPALPVASFRIAGRGVEEAGRILVEQHGIYCRTGLHCAPLIHQALGSAPEGTIRFSVSGFNTDEDVGHALAAVRDLAG